jgi:pentatricopeptide repeat domain-containing protein 1
MAKDNHIHLLFLPFLQADAITYSAMINACEMGKQWEKAVSLFEQMTSRGVEANVITFNSLLGACQKSGQVTNH